MRPLRCFESEVKTIKLLNFRYIQTFLASLKVLFQILKSSKSLINKKFYKKERERERERDVQTDADKIKGSIKGEFVGKSSVLKIVLISKSQDQID